MAKLFLNSLYGKFGSNPQNYQKYETIESQYIKAAEMVDNFTFRGFTRHDESVALVSRDLNEEEMRFYNLATAASITGFVRAYLWKALCNSETPLYCDTDSIACKSSSVTIGKELGEWEKEGEFDKGAICGKKLYAFQYKNTTDFKIASKGARLNGNEIFSIAKGETIVYKNIAPTFSLKNETTFLERKIKLT